MRRKDRTIGTSDAIQLLVDCEYGILSTAGSNGQPYGVPLNFVYKNNSIYFHCATVGHKIDNIRDNPKVSFCVIGHTNVIPAEFATEYESAMAFGTASEVEGDEKHNALMWIIEKYSPEFMEEGKSYIQKYDKAAKVIKIQIDGISGKARR